MPGRTAKLGDAVARAVVVRLGDDAGGAEAAEDAFGRHGILREGDAGEEGEGGGGEAGERCGRRRQGGAKGAKQGVPPL